MQHQEWNSDEESNKCKHCDGKINVKTRYFDWYCTPKAKYNEEPYWTEFDINLCEECSSKTTECESLIGWDWWDAFDHLCCSYLYSQDYRDQIDAQNANFFKLSVEELRNNRKEKLNQINKTK